MGKNKQPLPRQEAVARQRATDEMQQAINRLGFPGWKRPASAARYLAALVESSATAIIGLDLQERVVAWNRGAERLYGFTSEEARGRSVSELVRFQDPSEQARVLQGLHANRDVPARQTRHVGRDGSALHVCISSSPVRGLHGDLLGASWIIRDVSEQMRTLMASARWELERQQGQKMEAISRLAGGVAHDFNNLLAGIQGLAEELQAAMPPEDGRQEPVREIMRAGDRAFELIGELLAFGRRQAIQPRVMDLQSMFGEFRARLPSLVRPTIRCTCRVLQPCQIWMDPRHFSQMLIQLAMNAQDAMPDGGSLSIEARPIVIGEKEQRALFALAPGPYVHLRVKDSGCGMDANTRSRVFEPFFSTQPSPKRPGLGLATVYGLIKQSRGAVTVDSQRGRGTTFHVYLPAALTEEVGLRPPDCAAAPDCAKRESILVVEDEALVRRVVVQKLRRQGYNVIAAEHAQEALRLVQGRPAFQLVISDVMMPGLSGPEMVQKLKEVEPQLRVLYISGFPEGLIAERGFLDPNIHFLEKAAISGSLLPRVRQILDEAVKA